MKTALRWVVVCVVGASAAAPYAAYARSPMSNGVGDGEANVPFASQAASADELGGGSGEPGRAAGDGARGKAAGREGRAPGRRGYRVEPPRAAPETETETDADRALEQTAP